MIAELVISWFEWWMVPTLISVVLGSIIIWPQKKQPERSSNMSVNILVGGMEALMIGFVKTILMVGILLSWVVYFVCNR